MHKENLSILIVIRHPVGGIRTFIRYVYRLFDPEKYKITIIAPDLEEMRTLLDDLFGYDVTFYSVSQSPSLGEFLKAILRTIRLRKVDLIHSQGLTAGVLCILPARLLGVTHIMTAHDTFNKRQFKGIKGAAIKVLLSCGLPFINKIHCVSNDVKQNYVQYIPTMKLIPNRLHVIMNGVESERFLGSESVDLRNQLDLPPESFLIGFLGRFMSQKGFRYLMEAMALLVQRKDLSRTPIVITFGEGGFIREEKRQIKNMGLERHVHFLPFIDNVAPVIKGLDVVAMPSLWEACALLPMEVMISGTPLITTDCIGIRETIMDTPAIIVPPANSQKLYEALAMEIGHGSKARFKEFSHVAAKRFDVRDAAHKIQQLFEEMR